MALKISSSMTTVSVNQTDQNHELLIPESISLSRSDVKVALFQFLFGEEDIVPGNHDVFWREFVNFANLHSIGPLFWNEFIPFRTNSFQYGMNSFHIGTNSFQVFLEFGI